MSIHSECGKLFDLTMDLTLNLQSTSGAELLSVQQPLEFKRWNHYVETSCTPDTYYRPQYVTAYAGNADERMVAVVIPTRTNRFLLPLVVRPIPISDHRDFDAITPYGYGGVLPLDGRVVTAADASELLMKLRHFCREHNIISLLLRLHPQLLQHEWLQSALDEDTALIYHGKTAAIECSKWDISLDEPLTLAKGRRSDLSVARRELTVRCIECGTSDGDAALETFRSIYELTMDRLRASPFYIFSKDYYSALAHGLGRDMCVINASRGNVVVGAAIFFAGCEFAHYHLSGTTEEGRKFRAGTIILVEAARWARQRQCHWLHLGGGTHADDGLFRFKQSFGGPTYQYHFTTAVVDRRRYDALTDLRNSSPSLPSPRAGFFPQYRA
jgi:hypothetical protein